MEALLTWIAIFVILDMASDIAIDICENRKRKKWDEQGKRYIIIEPATWKWWR